MDVRPPDRVSRLKTCSFAYQVEDRGFWPFHDLYERPFGATPAEDRGFGSFHDLCERQFGATPVEDRGFGHIWKPIWNDLCRGSWLLASS